MLNNTAQSKLPAYRQQYIALTFAINRERSQFRFPQELIAKQQAIHNEIIRLKDAACRLGEEVI